MLTEEIEKELEKFEQDKQDQLAKLKQIEDKEELKELTYQRKDWQKVNGVYKVKLTGDKEGEFTGWWKDGSR